MSKPAPLPLNELLRAPEAAGWQAKLTAVFFDAEAKRQCIAVIREGVASFAPHLSADELNQLQTAVVGRLVGLASRDARQPAAAETPAVQPLGSDEVQNAVLRSYPYPIAAPYHKFEEQEPGAGAFGCLLDTFEGLLHYLATVVVSAYFRSGLASDECNRHLLERFRKETWSTGDLLALLRDTVRLGGDCNGMLPYRELPAYLFVRGKPSPSCLVLESFVTLRNRGWGHKTGRDDEFYAGILPANRDRLVGELALTPWLADWQLIRPTVIDEAGLVSRADILVGDLRRKACSCELRLQPADLAENGGDVRAENSLLLVAPDRQRYLPLFPLSVFHFQLRSQGVYFLQRTQWQRAGNGQQLRRACYVTYQSGQAEHEESRGEPAVRSLELHLQRLEERLNAAGIVPAPPAEAPPAERDPDCELAEVRHEQAFHLRTFAGREALLQQAASWIDRQTEGGYLLLLGPPGQGKSALMAELARREAQRHPCLLHMVKSHRNPLKFIPSLLSQAARFLQARFGAAAYQGDADDLRNALVSSLEAVRERAGAVVWVLDALDELEASAERLTFLPPTLPAGVRVVLSCRPDIPLVQALRARLRQLEEWPLPALSEDDLQPVLVQRLGAGVVASLEGRIDWRALFHRLQGNPLFLQRALDRITRALAANAEDASAIDLAALPASLEAVFQDICNEVAERTGTRPATEEGRQKARLLQILSLAREPLGLEQLAEILAADGRPLGLEDCRDRLFEMSQYLLEVGDNRFKPWHQGLSDHVRDKVLGEPGCRQLEAVFCTWLRRPADRQGLYGLRHRVSHMLAAGVLDELAGLLLELSFLEARAEAGLAYELAVDFADALRCLPPDHPHRGTVRLLGEALRGDVQFIARHPGTLFQCLWNRCWWYDCPQAAPHYDLPPGGWPPEGPPWERPGPKLFALLEGWHKQRQCRPSRPPWLRSLLPPAVPLGSVQRTILWGHENEVRSVSFSPDERWLVSGADDWSVRLWDTRSGQMLRCLQGHGDRVTGVAFTPDGRHIVSGSEDHTVRVWDAESGAEILVCRGCKNKIGALAVAPDGRTVAAASRDRVVHFWDLASGAEQGQLTGHKAKVTSLAFVPDGRRLVTASLDRTIRVWDVASGQIVWQIHCPQHRVVSVAFAPDGRQVVFGSDQGSLHLCDADTGMEWGSCQLSPQAVLSVQFSPRGHLIAAGTNRGTVHVWDWQRGQELTCLQGHVGPVHSVGFSPDGRHLVTGAWDRTVRVWEVQGGWAPAALRAHKETILALAFAPAGQRLATGSAASQVQVWDVASGLETLCCSGHTNVVRVVVYSPDGRLLATGSRDQTICLWDTDSGAALWRLTGHEGPVYCLAFSGDRRLVSGSGDATVRVWDLETGKQLACCRGHTDQIAGVGFSGLGTRIVSAARDETVRVWDTASGKEQLCLGPLPHDIRQVAFLADDTGLVLRGNRGRVWLYDLTAETWREVSGVGRTVAAIAAGRPPQRWWAMEGQEEVIILETATGREIAWFPRPAQHLRSPLVGHTWAAADPKLRLFTLEE